MTVHGMMAEFETTEALLEAIRQARAAGYRRIDAYSPFAAEGLAESLRFSTRLPYAILLCGALSGAGAYYVQHHLSAIGYPLNVGGRPLDSWPAFTLITFEFIVLGAALAAFVGMLALNRLPQPYHPAFHLDSFERASQDRFFLCIEASDPLFEAEAVRSFLNGLRPLEVREVPA